MIRSSLSPVTFTTCCMQRCGVWVGIQNSARSSRTSAVAFMGSDAGMGLERVDVGGFQAALGSGECGGGVALGAGP